MQTALITGASSGIGEALAKLFAKDGHNVVLVARSTDKLEELAQQLESAYSIRATVESADLARRGGAKKLAAAVRELEIDVDVLVNSAGVMEHSFFVDMPATEQQRMIDLNVSGLTSMLKHFLPAMVARGHGRVLNVASIAAFQPIPGLATYAATKAYVLSLTESMAEELSGTGVTITALCPGFTHTDFHESAGMLEMKNSLPKWMWYPASTVVADGIKAVEKGKPISISGRLYRWVDPLFQSVLTRRLFRAPGR